MHEKIVKLLKDNQEHLEVLKENDWIVYILNGLERLFRLRDHATMEQYHHILEPEAIWEATALLRATLERCDEIREEIVGIIKKGYNEMKHIADD